MLRYGLRPYSLASVPGPDRRLNPPIAARIPVAMNKEFPASLVLRKLSNESFLPPWCLPVTRQSPRDNSRVQARKALKRTHLMPLSLVECFQALRDTKSLMERTAPPEALDGAERGVILYYTIKCVRTDVALFLCSSCYGMVETLLVGVSSRL